MPASPPKAPPAPSPNVSKVLLKALAVLEELIARYGAARGAVMICALTPDEPEAC